MQKSEPENLFHYSLHRLFDNPAVVVVGGIWRSGKTDFALYIAETLMKLNYNSQYDRPNQTVISQMASNIDTKGTFPLIEDMLTLKQWLYGTAERKLYIFDEANIYLQSRRSMSGMNTGVMRLFGEISKAHARMIFIGQNITRLDKELLDPIWVRGLFIKKDLKTVQLMSHLLKQTVTFHNIPACSIPFDTYAPANFQERPKGTIIFKDEKIQLLWDFSNDATYKTLGVHPMELNRLVRKFIHATLEQRFHSSHTQAERTKEPTKSEP